jgi:hypothetical protein
MASVNFSAGDEYAYFCSTRQTSELKLAEETEVLTNSIKLRGRSPQANSTDRATAACQRS